MRVATNECTVVHFQGIKKLGLLKLTFSALILMIISCRVVVCVFAEMLQSDFLKVTPSPEQSLFSPHRLFSACAQVTVTCAVNYCLAFKKA